MRERLSGSLFQSQPGAAGRQEITTATRQRLSPVAEEKLAPHYFIRVRKSAIVNSACISEIRPMFDGVYDIILAEGTVVTSSRIYGHKLRALLES
jgi:DNA-binding LytR/AlgR family response regulator